MNKIIIFLLLCFFYCTTAKGDALAEEIPDLEDTYYWLADILGDEFNEEQYRLDRLIDLQTLLIDKKCLDDDSLRFLAPLKNLRAIYIPNDNCEQRLITGRGFKWLSDLKKLEELDFDYNDIRPIYFFYLSHLTNLHTLSLRGNKLNEKKLFGLLFLSQLKTLHVNTNNFNNNSLKNLSVLTWHPNLITLDIGDNAIDGSSLSALSHLRIKKLVLDGWPNSKNNFLLNEELIIPIKSMKNLTTLSINYLDISKTFMTGLFSTQIKYLHFNTYTLSLDETLEMILHSNIELIKLSPEIIQNFIKANKYADLYSALSVRSSIALQISHFNDKNSRLELGNLTEGLPVKTLFFSYFDSIENELPKLELFPELKIILLSYKDYPYLKRAGEVDELQNPESFNFDVYHYEKYTVH
ncbi:hypothetical protein [Pseudoalteromonas denitrificans]|uniref:Leucine-rich repeat domain-containing protein n=1 Tax=Pseudoalteromonas denitrificans DSM 6059 TaxID=1123010 RepID=A0A1I1KMH8_9GAMM|nr:hypothetical protein [Pseudoalteromonas denitrificans]SFC61999.1 hypothetical protein SAMN02745724_02126 [Pseudoalteromonas denitrificans DSM 6059]